MTAPSGTDDPLTTLAGEVAQLRDLFHRRMLEDKAKNRALDDLHEQLSLAAEGSPNSCSPRCSVNCSCSSIAWRR
ncbi:hypothetical protein [Nocardia sp. NPDC005745]|uniref:hypothetical protein n=1 Tax=Nocardia sp. NPDC005745 TaxID=3157061 RepID=UPI00340070E8